MTGDPTVVGFVEQCRHVCVGVDAALHRSLTEGWSMVLEGVHLVPGLVPRTLEGALLVHVVLEIADEDVHRLHFHVRDGATGGSRAMEKYLERIDDIRRIQTYVSGRAQARGCPGGRECERGPGDRRRDGARDGCGRAFPGVAVTQVEESAGESAPAEADRPQCQCETFARVTERAALAGARWLGRADKEAAEEASFSAARHGARADADQRQGRDRRATRTPSSSRPARSIGAGGEEYDLALDPLEGRAVVARGGTNAISMIAASPRGSMPSLPDMYMRKMAVGPRARGPDRR